MITVTLKVQKESFSPTTEEEHYGELILQPFIHWNLSPVRIFVIL